MPDTNSEETDWQELPRCRGEPVGGEETLIKGPQGESREGGAFSVTEPSII